MAEEFGGTSTVTPAVLPTFGGVSTVTFAEPTTETFGGVSTVDLSTAEAWSSPMRMTNVRVVLDGEDVTGLVGTVRVSLAEDSPSLACEFELVDARNAALHPYSFAIGGRAVEVWVSSRSRSGKDERCVFIGTTESPSNDEPYVPRASYRAIGAGQVWNEAEVCTRIPAFSGLRRYDVLRTEAALLGLTLSTTIHGAELTKPWEFIGTKYWEFLQRQAELEDVLWQPQVDGSLVGMTWDEVKDQSSVATIRWSNSFPLREDPPNRPITKAVLSGAMMTDDVLDQTVRTYQVSTETTTFGRKSGRVWKVTVNGGVATQTIEEEYETWALLGASVGADEYRLKRRTTVVMTYPTVVLLNGETRFTPALSQRVTEVEEYGAPQTNESGTLWTDGTYRTQSEETFALRQRVTEDFVYLADDGSATACQLSTTTIKVEAYYGELVARVRHNSDGTENTTDRWADGSYHETETFQTTRETVETWTDNIGTDAPRRVERRQDISAWVEKTPERGYQYGGGLSTTISPSEEYKYAGAITDVWVESHMNGVGERIRSDSQDSSYAPSMESIPDIPRASALVPQYATDVFKLDWTLSDHAYPENVVTDFLEGAESTSEALTVAQRRIGWSLGTKWTIPVPMIPGLKRWDKVRLIDDSRYADLDVYVLGYGLELDPTNGWLGDTLIVSTRAEGA